MTMSSGRVSKRALVTDYVATHDLIDNLFKNLHIFTCEFRKENLHGQHRLECVSRTRY